LHILIFSLSDRTREEPNVVVEWLTLLLRLLEVPDANLGLKTGYRD
jgi:hypothetical protein